MSPGSRRRLALLVGVMALVLGHVAFWYWPRLRPGVPDDEAARLLHHPAFSAALWLPYPHQTLPALQRDAGLDVSVLTAVGRLAGVGHQPLPPFGTMSLPVASSLTLVVDDSGDRFAARARIYPLFALFVRLAGTVAGNAWLSGGEVVIDGRPIEVAWDGLTWKAGSPSLPTPASGATESTRTPPEKALGVIHLSRESTYLPAGELALVRDDGVYQLTGEQALPDGGPWVGGSPVDASASEVVILLIERQPPVVGGMPRLSTQAMALLPIAADRMEELPRAVSLSSSSDRWELPAEGLLRAAGRQAMTLPASGLVVSAFDRIALDAGRRLAPEVRRWSDPRGRLLVGAWMEMEAASVEARRIHLGLRDMPMVPQHHRQRWADIDHVLATLDQRFERLTVIVADGPKAVRVVLE